MKSCTISSKPWFCSRVDIVGWCGNQYASSSKAAFYKTTTHARVNHWGIQSHGLKTWFKSDQTSHNCWKYESGENNAKPDLPTTWIIWIDIITSTTSCLLELRCMASCLISWLQVPLTSIVWTHVAQRRVLRNRFINKFLASLCIRN